MEPKMEPGARKVRFSSPSIGWFVSPHGFGHAARSAAVMEAISAASPGARHHVFTTVPREFFFESLGEDGVFYHRCECDVGMIQHTPLLEDVKETIRALDVNALNNQAMVEALAAEVATLDCRLIVCDIAPLGLDIARRLSIPSVLVENFTWDWIYRAYGEPRLDHHGEAMASHVRSAGLVIQTEPRCCHREGAALVGPISRRPRTGKAEVRRRLGVSDEQRMVLFGMSGIEQGIVRDQRIFSPRRTVVVIPGPEGPAPVAGGPVIADGWFYPDLVSASDLVIAKLGYSTVAEVFCASTRLAYLRRPRFPESPVLEAFV
ncbi:MAG: hypothetical protein V2I67_14465, partial [Thermoanaerobaculales bacterium]|nr:hypothetical protein [Thermoanaerobaculales bacterium]